MTHFLPRTARRWGALGLLLTGLAGGFSACESDFDANDDYRETTLLYAILDPNEAVQTVRINKAFLNTKTNALDIAANHPDSITFPAEAIRAELQWLNRDLSVRFPSYPLIRTTVPRSPGTFKGTEQVVYQSPPGMPPLDSTLLYRVIAYNLRTGDSAWAVTSIPTRPIVRQVISAPIPISRLDDPTAVFNFSPENPGLLLFNTQPRAGIFQGVVDFNYLDIDGADTTAHTLQWNVMPNTLVAAVAQGERQVDMPARIFFGWLQGALDVSRDPPGRQRRVVSAIWHITAGSPQWGTYQQAINSYSAIAQTAPEYTNVQGGRGLVAGRNRRDVRTEVKTRFTQDAFRDYPQFKFVF